MAPTKKSRLTRGFGTLDPSARLRRHRTELSAREPVVDAWVSVRGALLDSRSERGEGPEVRCVDDSARFEAGAADRILTMAERAATGHHRTAEKLAQAETETAKMGQALAFLLSLIASGAAITFFAVGRNPAAFAFLSVPVLLLIRAFVSRS